MSVRAKKSSVEAEIQAIIKELVFLYTENRLIVKRLAAKASITGPQLSVVTMLSKIGDLSLTELSDAIKAQNSTMTGIVDRMEREGLVERIRSKKDRRVVRIHLTEKGHKVAAEIPVDPISIFREAIECLSVSDIRTLKRLVTRVSLESKVVLAREFPENYDAQPEPVRLARPVG